MVLGRPMTLRPCLRQVVGDLVRAVAAQADQAIETEAVVGLDGAGVRSTVSPLGSGILCGFSRLVPRMVPPERQDAGNVVLMQHARVVLDQAAKAFFDADDLDVEIAHGRLGDAADGRVEPGAIAAARQDADTPRLGRGHDAPPPRCFYRCSRRSQGIPTIVISDGI